MNFTEEIEKWLENVRGTVKPNTYAATYCNTVRNHLEPYFGEKDVSEVRQSDIQTYINIISLKYSVDTVKKHKSCLFMFYEWLLDNGIIGKNPVRNIRLRQKNKPVSLDKNIYTPEELSRLYEFAYSHRFGYEVQILIDTAITRSEVLGLTWNDVDFTRRSIRINKSVIEVHGAYDTGLYVSETKNVYRNREIPIPDRLVRILNEKHQIHTSEWVIPNQNGKCCNPTQWYRRHYAVFFADAVKNGIVAEMLSPHRIRHSRLSELVNSDINIYAISKLSGHCDLNMLRQRYAHTNLDELRKLLGM